MSKKNLLIAVIVLLILSLSTFTLYQTNTLTFRDNTNNTLRNFNLPTNFETQEFNSTDPKVQDFVFKDQITFQYPKGWKLGTAGQHNEWFPGFAAALWVTSDYDFNGRTTSFGFTVRPKDNSSPNFASYKNKLTVNNRTYYCSDIHDYLYSEVPVVPPYFGIYCAFEVEGFDNYWFSASADGGIDDKSSIENVIKTVIGSIKKK